MSQIVIEISGRYISYLNLQKLYASCNDYIKMQ